MQITKQNKPTKKNCSVIIDESLHQSISNLAHQERISRKDLIRKAILLYQKATIFEI